MSPPRNAEPTVASRTGRSLQASIYVLFFLSGAAALLFEILWSRQLVTVFGNSSYAISVVLCAFLGGLGLGSLLGGRLADRYPRRLLIYGLLQAGVALAAMAIPALLEVLRVRLPASLLAPQLFLVPTLTRFVVSFGVLVVPCTMMGATLPLLTRFCTDSVEALGPRVGMLYGLNTLGAAAGCFAGGFWTIPTLGLSGTNRLAVGLSLFIAAFVLVHSLARSRGAAPAAGPARRSDVTRPTRDESEPTRGARRLLLAVAFLTGMAGLCCEVLWVRYMSFFGNEPSVFTMILGTYLLGLGAGSLLYRSVLSNRARPLQALSWVVSGLGVAVPSCFGAGALSLSLGEPGDASRVVLVLVLVAVPAVLMGMTFPLVCSASAGSVSRVGRSVGVLQAVNTVGSIVGSVLPVFVLIPCLGMQSSLLLMGLLYVGLAWGLLGLTEPSRRGSRTRWMAAGSSLMVVVLTVGFPRDLCERSFLASSRELGRHNDILFYREGRTGTTVVVRDRVNGLKSLYINGTLEVPTRYVDMACFKLMGGLGPLLHAEPAEVLMICFGGGIAAGAAIRYEDVRSLEVVDLESGVVEAARWFARENNNLHDSPKLRVTIEDGRNYILVSRKRWPVIVADSTHPKSSDSWVLYTREFYELIAEHLTPDGVFVQWLPMHGLSVAEYQIILRTFQSVFPHASLWLSHGIAEEDGYIRYTLLVATPRRLEIDVASLRARLSAAAVAADLAPWYLGDPAGLLESFVCGEETLRRWTGDGAINTDDLPYTQYPTEYSRRSKVLDGGALAPLLETVVPYLKNTGKEEGHRLAQELARRREANRLMVLARYEEALSVLPEEGRTQRYRENRRENVQHLLRVAESYRDCPRMLHATGLELAGMGRLEEAIAHYERSVALDPRFAEAFNNLGVAWVRRGEPEEAIAHYDRAIALRPDFAEAHNNAGVALVKVGRPEEAIVHYERAIAARWDFAEAHNNLGLVLAMQGRREKAFAQVENAIRVDPAYVEARCLMGNLLGDAGRFDEAIAQFREALRIDPEHENTLRSLEIAERLRADSPRRDPLESP